MRVVNIILALLIPVMVSCRNQAREAATNNDLNDNALIVKDAKVVAEDEPQSVEDFVKEAASGGLMEVELGKFAQQNAYNQRVKNFGAMMVRDHQKANDELKSIAGTKNIMAPTSMENNHSDKVNELKKESGANFDKKYMDEMVDDHKKDVDKFRKQAENGKDPDIKAFAAKTLEILLIHQDSARNIKNAINR